MDINIGFDNELYLNEQADYIMERVNRFNHKLYLEFGGKLFSTITPPGCCPVMIRM